MYFSSFTLDLKMLNSQHKNRYICFKSTIIYIKLEKCNFAKLSNAMIYWIYKIVLLIINTCILTTPTVLLIGLHQHYSFK